MSDTPIPVLLAPHLVEKPWGGRRLAERFGKGWAVGARIGESWELVSAGGFSSRVTGGVHAGATVAQLIERWGAGLLGAAERFPLLIKFIDARESLSIQTHPAPADGAGGSACEIWFIVDAAPGSEVFIGFRPDAPADQIRAAAGKAAIVDLLQRWPARRGAGYVVPAGVAHAIGAGVLALEIQQTATQTYRLFDWNRSGPGGAPRELHLEAALANLRHPADGYGPLPAPDRERNADWEASRWSIGGFDVLRGVTRRDFMIAADDLLPSRAGRRRMTACVVLAGGLGIGGDFAPIGAGPGDTLLLPASGAARLLFEAGSEFVACAAGS